MFTAGEDYERFMGRWSRQLAPLLVRFAGVGEAQSVLDVGSGTGALAAAILDAAREVRVAGIDPSTPYVTYARRRCPDPRARFDVGDALHLPFPDQQFDHTLSLLILNFLPDPGRALGEMVRVTRVGGTVAAAVWDYGEGMGMLRAFWDEAVALDPGAAPTDERHMPLCRAGEIGALWRAHGLREVAEDALCISTPFASFDEYWSPFLAGQGPAGAYVAGLLADERRELARRLRHRLLGDGNGSGFVLSARAWAVRGTV
jgi:SAM-dependent methyltransferase